MQPAGAARIVRRANACLPALEVVEDLLKEEAALDPAERAALQDRGNRARFDEARARFGFQRARQMLHEIVRNRSQPWVILCGSGIALRSVGRIGHASRHRHGRSAPRRRSRRRAGSRRTRGSPPGSSAGGSGDDPPPLGCDDELALPRRPVRPPETASAYRWAAEAGAVA